MKTCFNSHSCLPWMSYLSGFGSRSSNKTAGCPGRASVSSVRCFQPDTVGWSKQTTSKLQNKIQTLSAKTAYTSSAYEYLMGIYMYLTSKRLFNLHIVSFAYMHKEDKKVRCFFYSKKLKIFNIAWLIE